MTKRSDYAPGFNIDEEGPAETDVAGVPCYRIFKVHASRMGENLPSKYYHGPMVALVYDAAMACLLIDIGRPKSATNLLRRALSENCQRAVLPDGQELLDEE